MDRDIHTDALIYRTTVLSEGLKLSEDTVERVVDIQKRYQRQGHSIDFVDFWTGSCCRIKVSGGGESPVATIFQYVWRFVR